MKERSDSNNFNSLTATLIELRTSRCPQHGRLIRITSIPRALIPIVADQPFPQPFPPPNRRPLFYFFSHAVRGIGRVRARLDSNHRSKLGEEVSTGGEEGLSSNWSGGKESLSQKVGDFGDWPIGPSVSNSINGKPVGEVSFRS